MPSLRVVKVAEGLYCAPPKREIERVTVDVGGDGRPEIERSGREDAVLEVANKRKIVVQELVKANMIILVESRREQTKAV